MKKNIFALFAFSLAVLVACQKEAKVADNPTYDPQENTVKTQFVMNVSTGTGKDTKTTASMAQVSGNFLGMDQVHLLAYQLDDKNLSSSNGHFMFNPYLQSGESVTPVAAVRDFDLGTLFGEGAVSSDNSSRTVELALPLGTNAVMFYGKATKMYDDDYQGYTKTEGDVSNLGTIKYSLKSRMLSQEGYNVGAFFFSRMLTYFVSAGLVNENTFWASPTGTTDRSYAFWYPIPSETVMEDLPGSPSDQTKKTVGGVEYTYYTGQVSWKQMGEMYFYQNDGDDDTKYTNADVKTTSGVYMDFTPLLESMGNAYYVLTTIKSEGTLKELRAGSASSVLRVCRDLYSIAERAATTDATSWSDECARQMASQLKDRMDRFFSLYNGELDFKRTSTNVVDITTLKTVISSAVSTTDWSTWGTSVNNLLDEDYFYNTSNTEDMKYGFPINVGLPYGASIMTCTTTGQETGTVKPAERTHVDQFSYVSDIPAYGFGEAYFPIANYRYPPELMYFGNSPLRISSDVKKAADYPSTVTNWADDSKWSGWTKNGDVLSSTRSVAMTDNINYGTALLRSTVKYAEGITELEDNNKALHPNEENNKIPTGGLLVTGLIVGGQPDVVGWDYVRRPDNAGSAAITYDAEHQYFTGETFTNNGFDKMVYDRVVGGYSVGTSTTPIYTMVWDNYDSTKPADQQNDVYVGIELLNNTGHDFWGEMNLIRNGGVFYLLGKLDLSTAVEKAGEGFKTGISRSDYRYPPYNPSTGATIDAPRVFMQDYMTVANLILTETSLQHAYVTVPDLRSSQISLGVSIDLAWKEGLAFDVNMGTLD